MKTAKTIQLLDANNTNISPAVCIESLYFEQTDNTNTYRISLKNRTVIASNTIINYNNNSSLDALNNGNNISEFMIPYVYVDILRDNTFQVCELNTGTYNIGRSLSNCVSTWCNSNFYNKQNAFDKFIRMDENDLDFDVVNRTNGFYCGTNDSSMHIHDVNGSGVIDWNNGTTKIEFINTPDEELKITRQEYQNYISLSKYNQNELLSLNSDYVNLVANCSFIVDSGDVVIMTTANMNFDANGYIDFTTGLGRDFNVSSGNNILLKSKGDIRLTPVYDEENETNVFLYDYKLQRPLIDIDPDEHRIYTLALDSSDLSWIKFPKLYLKSYGGTHASVYDVISDNVEDTSLYIRGLTFYKDYIFDEHGNISSYREEHFPILYDTFDNNSVIGIRGIKSGIEKESLFAVSENATTEADFIKYKFVNFRTLNGESLLGNTDLEVLTQSDLNGHNKIRFNQDPVVSNTFSLIGSYNTEFTKLNATESSESGTLYYMSRIYFRTNNCIYATGYYASSDKRLKDNIEEVQNEDVKDVPSIKNFTWKSDNRKSYGFIAQELIESGHEELVTEDAEGMYKVDYNAALSLKCAQLEKQNKELSERISKLEALVEKLI